MVFGRAKNVAAAYYAKRAREFTYYLSLFSATLIILSACSSNKKIEWREETRLSNGQIVVVERRSEYRSVYAGGTGNDWFFQHARIKTAFQNKEIVWDGGIEPLALDVTKSGEIYLVAIAVTSQGQAEYSIPASKFHAAFKFDGVNQWTRIPIEAVPHEIHPNLLIDEAKLYIDKKESTDGVLELTRKEKLNTENYYADPFRHWPTE